MTNILKPNEVESRDCVAQSDGKRTFLKLGTSAVAALTHGGIVGKSAQAADGKYFSLPVAPQTGAAVDLGSGDIGVLNYAFALEQTELAFLRQLLASPYRGIMPEERRIFQEIHDQEVVHNEFFRRALGARAIPALQTDFSRVNFNNRRSVLTAAQTFADLGTSAYNGAGKLLTDPQNLLIAGKIVSVEARHASVIRDLIRPRSFYFAPAALDPALDPPAVLRVASAFVRTPINAGNLPRS